MKQAFCFWHHPQGHTHTHLIGLLKRGVCHLIHLLIKWTWKVPWPRKLDARAHIHTGFIIRKHLAKATEHMLFHTDQRRQGRKWRVVPLGRTPRSNDTPGLPPSRCSATRTPQCPRVWLEKFLTCHIWTKPPYNLNHMANQAAERPT